jgi:16S rRNA (guanine527-N7)-methyltransferase
MVEEQVEERVETEQERLSRLAERWGVALPAATALGLLSFGRLLLEWNRRFNLTGAKSLAALVDDHLPDAFAVAAQLAGNPAVLDVGSGGGLPAIPAAWLAPGASFLLLEPIHKKAAFLRTAARPLGSRVAIATRRLEDGLPAKQAPFDVAVSRATFAPGEWLRRAERLVRPGGKVLALTASPSVEAPPGLRLAEVVPYESDARRWLLVLVRST